MYAYNRSAIKPNPLLETYRVTILAMGIATALALIITVLMVIVILMGGQARNGAIIAIIDLPVFGLGLLSSSQQYRYWKRIEQRRLSAAEGNHTLLAEEQPVPDAGALRFPASFKMSMSKAQITLSAIFLAIVILFFGIYGWVMISVIPFWPFLVGGGVLMLIVMLLIVTTSGQVLEVTEMGLVLRASRLSGFRGMVHWNEAHLFAVYAIFGARKSGAVLTYELSSASSIVRWTRVLRPNSFGLHMDPGVPLAEHNQAMEALCQLIVARTGLPLYDLRKEHTLENQKSA